MKYNSKEHDLGFCQVQVVDPQIIVFRVSDGLTELSKANMLEIEKITDRVLDKPFGIVADRRGLDYSLSPCAIEYVLENPSAAVMATVSANPVTSETLFPLSLSVIEHRIFPELGKALEWVQSRLDAMQDDFSSELAQDLDG